MRKWSWSAFVTEPAAQSLQPSYLVFEANFGSQGVFRAPLLGERQPVLCPLVLGFQVSRDFAVVDVGGARCFKLLDLKTTTTNQRSWKEN